MKITRRILVLLLIAVFALNAATVAFASVSPSSAEGTAGQTVTVTFKYNGIAGIQGTFTYTNPQLFSNIKLTPAGLTAGSYNPDNGMVAYFGMSPVDCTITLDLTIATGASVGDNCTINFKYESSVDGSFPAEPEYKYDSVTVTVKANLDYSKLSALISQAERLDKSEYTSDTWNTLASVLADAKSALTATTQSAIDSAVSELQAAINGLERLPTVNYDELNKQIRIAEGLDEDDYTPYSWSAMETALNAAKAALSSTSQSTVDEAANDLAATIKALVPWQNVQSLVFGELREQIDRAESLEKSEYTQASWSKLESALADAKTALSATTQSEIDVATDDLKAAIDALVKATGTPAVDYAALIKQITIAEGLSKDSYTAESWAELTKALSAARAARNSDSQSTVDNAANALKAAIAKLVSVNNGDSINYSELNKQIAIAEGLVASDYTADTWSALQSALASAKEACNADSQSIVDNATSVLASAIAALERVEQGVDYTELNKQIAIAEGLTSTLYTTESWDALIAVLEEARTYTDSELQSEVDKATDDLKAAIAALVVIDYQPLKDAVASVGAYAENEKLADLWAQMGDLLDRAEEVLVSGDQAAVDALTEEINNLLAAIKEETEALKKVETVVIEKPVPTDPEDDFCNIKSHRIWPILFWISLALNIAFVAFIVAYYITKNKKRKDDTPLVDYDIADDDIAVLE